MTTENYEKVLHSKTEAELVEAMRHTAHTARLLEELGDKEDAEEIQRHVNEELTAIFDLRVAPLHPHP